MHPPCRFSSGLELASFAVTTDHLYHSWAAISELRKKINEPVSSLSPVKYEISPHRNFTSIAFVTKEHLQAEGGGDLVPSSTLQENFPLFQFLCTETNPHFSINKHAQSLFASIHESLPFLHSQVSDSKTSIKPLIITGHSLGGSVASLFTLWLLNEINFATAKRPLCVTFGSPLIGDGGLRKAISKYSAWNSCFLHVVSDQDPVPRVFISPHNPPESASRAAKYKPFITSGSPLIGDGGLRKATSKYSAWNSCFSHVVSYKDPVPHNPPESASRATKYKPFGTFLLCSELGCACLEDPKSILKLLMMATPTNQIPHLYGTIVEQLNSKVICKECVEGDEWIARLEGDVNRQTLKAGIIKQLAAIGLGRSQSINDTLITELEKQERKLLMRSNEVFDAITLTDMKINMAELEWYKKSCKDGEVGYYDSYKNARQQRDVKVEQFKKSLTIFCMDIVDEVEKRPQKEGTSFRTRWLFAGTNYRRMIEPLVIAEHYRCSEPTDYIKIGRLKERNKHFKQLEQWLEKEEKPASVSINSKKQKVKANLTEDSCFWAHVEEALISYQLLSDGNPGDRNIHTENLKNFEVRVLKMLKNYTVSPEIFLQGSSFMKWWKEYKKIIEKGSMGAFYSSQVNDLMKTGQYKKYADGELEIL